MSPAGEWIAMQPSPGADYVAPALLGTASLIVGLSLEATVAHALLVSAALVGGMAAGTVVRLFARRLRPPRTDG